MSEANIDKVQQPIVKFNPTPAQRAAVEMSGQTMLVSAAAGSGKTSVLTKRIIRLVTDSNSPVNVSDLLVVTFTKAAASELRQRISDAIYEALSKDPTNKHLSNQLLQLGKARICTIHSFCADLVKGNFQSLGLPASLRVADESESALICNNIMNALIEECYGGFHTDKINDFVSLSELFLQDKKDDSLPFVFFKIYNYFRNFPLGIDMLSRCADELEEGSKIDPFMTKWGLNIKKHIKLFFEYWYKRFSHACNYLCTDKELAEKFLPSYEVDRDFCRDLVGKIDRLTYSELSDTLAKRKAKNTKTIDEDCLSDKAKEYKAMRKKFAPAINDGVKCYLTFKEETVKDQLLKTAAVCREMYGVLSLFDARYREEKKSRGVLDYNDLENYTLRLLYSDKNCNEPSQLSESLKERFKYIFIDEYQDVNELQDKIFSGICTETNRFMVGDIKQSIYGFRGAEPSLFSGYRSRFPTCDPEKKIFPDGDAVTLYLSNNFRSDHSVIDFSNAVFKVLFNNNSGKIPYTEGDKLVCTKQYKEGEVDHKVRLCFVENNVENKKNAETDDEADGDEFNAKAIEVEAEFVANEIEKLKNNGLDLSKIAILLRSRANAIYFEEALKKKKIDSFNKEDRDFFENDAVLLRLCILNTVDNPSRDIYLAGTLKSPIFGFTLSELTKIRYFEKNGTLYDALKKYTKSTNDKKCLYFLEKLNEWREYSEGCPVDKLVKYIYNQTHIVEMLSGKMTKDADVERQANLLLLYEYARNFENGSFKGLYNFILYLDDVLEKRTKLGNARLTSEGQNVVSIMTVHNSKGLEFDTVFFVDTGHNFNRMDERAAFIMHKECGFSVKLRDSTTFGKYDTMLCRSARLAMREDVMDEEIRVLYVALTRAKKRLIITSSMPNPKEMIDFISSDESDISHYVLLKANNISELLLWGIRKSQYNDYDIEYIPMAACEPTETDLASERKEYDVEEVKTLRGLIEKNLEFKHPYSELSNLPAKLAVSKLYPGVLDEFTTEIVTVAPSMYVMPKFMSDTPIEATGAEKGTATHLFMQFCDFANVINRGVKAELDRLLEKGFIDSRNAKLVDLEKVQLFFESDLFCSISRAQNIWREKRFNISLSASDFTNSKELKDKYRDENILVQGVIDLLYLDESGKLVLVDYKTDWFSEKQIESGDAVRILKERHRTQLSYYAEACRRMFGISVDKTMIYSFALNKAVAL